MLRYAELKGFKLYVKDSKYGLGVVHYFTTADMDENNYFCPRDIERADPVLVQVVEELGQEASGQFAELRITEIPTGTKYRIDEYDGKECVMTIDDYNWETA